MKEKVILAYSGGLDTTVLIPWLKENYDYDHLTLEILHKDKYVFTEVFKCLVRLKYAVSIPRSCRY